MTLLLTTPNALVLLVFIGVGGCLCPMNSRLCRAGTASWQFMYSAPTLASAAGDNTALIICDIVNTAPLLVGNLSLFDMK